MDTFPYETWDEALANAGAEGYFTFGPGGNFATIVLTIIGIIVMIAVYVTLVTTEDKRLREQVERLQQRDG